MQDNSWNGKSLREMFRTGTTLLSNNSAAVNALNVFPVPDGDTGTNMLLTMQAAMVEANLCPDNDASAVAQAMAQGALMGARGNSGVILSQILRGLAKGLEGKKSFEASDMAQALTQASIMADKAVSQPVEGTILTVMREAATAAKLAINQNPYALQTIFEAVAEEAQQSVNRTPSLLPILHKAGVVDAGGEGLRIILEGILYFLEGKEIKEESSVEVKRGAEVSQIAKEEYGYCTEFLIHGDNLDLAAIRATLCEMGEHVLVVGDKQTARIHVHTFDPGTVLDWGTSLGLLSKIKVDNMEDQHREFITSRNQEANQVQINISTIAVVSGEGLVDIFKSLGATNIVRGGHSMNPSVQDLFQAVESAPTEEVIILPNNGDILPAARQVRDLSDKKVAVVPSRTIVQGVAALIAFNNDADFEHNVETMKNSISSVRTGEISTSVRSMEYKDLQVKEGQIIGFVDEELCVAEYTIEETLRKLLEKMNVDKSEILTAYYGEGVDWASAEKLFEPVRSQYPDLEVEVVFGGQPHYHYLISLE